MGIINLAYILFLQNCKHELFYFNVELFKMGESNDYKHDIMRFSL